MTIAEKQKQLLGELGGLTNSQDRFAFVVKRGRQSPALDAAFKTEASRIDGCLARLWLICERKAGKCYFRTDSDSAIVKGIAVILCDLYSDQTPEEILSLEPSFLEKVGIDQHLTQNRRHSLGKVWERIRSFAQGAL